ncbi:hypothetical protein SKAU_G00269750 [Synaphobranchus kaupii]|uniref:THAP-type domain-containing protein n=1 Tax=Synaphobranchus kaupii TaxID=118154 RepID=A0A9Q1F0D7_SYNKA|nr:hypothetical protein SKAU_G00269750 [Synaphobranchus kaupii]
MGRTCLFPGCKMTTGLHNIPRDPEMARRWMQALGIQIPPTGPPPAVCNAHFARECFSNVAEVEMGFAFKLLLQKDAVPTPATPLPVSAGESETGPGQPRRLPPLPEARPTSARPLRLLAPKRTREIGCQTEPPLAKHEAVQANVKPYRRSKAIQATVATSDKSCETSTSVAIPEEVPMASSTRKKRPRLNPMDDSSFCPDVTESTVYGERTSNETT